MNKNTHKGFTLIELLVVVAIIGILSSIVLAALGSARTRARDAAVKGAMSQIRAQAELCATSGVGYNYGCLNGTNGATQDPQITALNTNVTQNGGSTVSYQIIAGSGFSAATTLQGSTTFCVDSTGFAGPAPIPGTGDITCN